MSDKKTIFGFTTTTLHADRQSSIEHGAIHKPIHTSVAFEYPSARQLADVFQGKTAGYAYGRQSNPTTAALEDKITKMEDGVGTVCFSTGMNAIASTMISLLRNGDHIISSSFLFGNTNSLFGTLKTLGISVSFVDITDNTAVKAALQPNTKMLFLETIANPVTQIADLDVLGEWCKDNGIIYFIDNTMTSPFLFRPKEVGASLVINSLTKFIAGHGNALGGSITDTGLFDWKNFTNIYDNYKKGEHHKWGLLQIKKKGLRDTGGTLTAESAHHIAIGAETLALRQTRSCSNALALAEFLSKHPLIKHVNYPGLETHPQHILAKTHFKYFGALMSFELTNDIDCFDFLDKLSIIITSSNLGDNRTLAIPVAHTIFYEMGAERRKEMGIDDNLIRLSVGIEDIDDLIKDIELALA